MLQPSPRRATRARKGNDREEETEIQPTHNGEDTLTANSSAWLPDATDQDEVTLDPTQTLQWLALNRYAEEREKHMEANKEKYCEEKMEEVERQLKRTIDLNDILKSIDDECQEELRMLEIQKQRRLEQIEVDYAEDCEDLQEKYQIAQEKLTLAWKELYPEGKRRKAYPKSIRELLDRYDPPEDTSDDEGNINNYPDLIQEIIDRVDAPDHESEKDLRYRLYRTLTKKNEEEIKESLAQMYFDPDDTPEPTDLLQSLFTGSASPSPKPSRTASPSF